jgi:uncharacterized membrane protein (GlpM family)
MIKEMLLRIGIGGSMVTGFALLGDVIKPKRFAGLFGAAPSVALATLLLATKTQGKAYAATEARSMVGGAIAFLVYSYSVYWLSFRCKFSALASTFSVIALWFVVAFGVWLAWLKGQ